LTDLSLRQSMTRVWEWLGEPLSCRRLTYTKGFLMLYRLKKIATSFAYLLLIWLTWEWFHGNLAWGFSLSCVLVSAFWIALTWFELGHLFRTYFDVFSRLKMTVPIALGLVISALAVVWGAFELKVVGGVEIALWLVIYGLYLRNKRQYRIQGHGPMPKDAWINPPVEALNGELELILTSGNMANRLRETVGHGEVAVKLDGKVWLLSSYMEKGTVLQEASRVANSLARKGHYIALKLTKPLTEHQKAMIPHLVQVLLEQNCQWRSAAQARRERFINALPVPKSTKAWLINKLRVTGYDWLGLLAGQRHSDHWTCIGICLEFYHRLGIKTNEYGTGILGLGTGLLDPIMPVRFLSDPAFRLMTEADRREYEARKATA